MECNERVLKAWNMMDEDDVKYINDNLSGYRLYYDVDYDSFDKEYRVWFWMFNNATARLENITFKVCQLLALIYSNGCIEITDEAWKGADYLVKEVSLIVFDDQTFLKGEPIK